MAVGEYEAMWLFVGFDLPTLTVEDRRRASTFRSELVKMGFTMFQLSFYTYYFRSKDEAETIANKICRIVPENGTVSVIFITDKQFGMIRTFFGGKKIKQSEPEQLLLF